MEVSVRELKIRLSHYLRLVAEGQPITVTSHRKPVAQLAPKQSDKQGLAALEGVVWNGKKPTGGRTRPTITGKTVSERVLEDRR